MVLAIEFGYKVWVCVNYARKWQHSAESIIVLFLICYYFVIKPTNFVFSFENIQMIVMSQSVIWLSTCTSKCISIANCDILWNSWLVWLKKIVFFFTEKNMKSQAKMKGSVLLWKLILYQSLMILCWTNFIKCIYWKSNGNVKLVLSAPLVWVFIVTPSPASC